MKNIVRLTFLFLGLLLGHAQEFNLPIHAQYLGDNPYLISASYAGIGDNIQVRLNGLTQWVGVKDAPDTQSLAVDGRISDNSGAGLMLFNDKNGYTRQYGGQLSFAHHLTLSQKPDQYLSFGISYKFTQFKIENENFANITGDPNSSKNLSEANSNFDVSMLYRYNAFYASLNVANILDKNLYVFSDSEPKKIRNYYLYSGYVFKKGRFDLEFEPSVLVQYFESDNRSSTDFNFKFRKRTDIEDYLWAGISYRFLNDQLFNPLAIIPMGGIKTGSFYAAYGYQANFNETQGFNTGTHMLTIGLDFFQGIGNCPCTHDNHGLGRY